VIAAVQALESLHLADPTGVIDGLLASPNEGLRRAAVRHRLAVDRDPIPFARRLLDGDDPALRQHVVDALFEHPSRASGAVTADWVDARIAAGTPESLLLAAQAMGAMVGPPLVKQLRGLLAHPNVEIRRAALISAGRRPARELRDVLMELLLDPEVALEARAAVAALGNGAVPALRRLLEDPRDEKAQGSAARTLAYIATPRAALTLMPLVRSRDVRLRHLGLMGLARARARSGRPVLTRALAHRLFLRELNEYRACREPGRAHQNSMEPEVRLLAESYVESAGMALDRAIAALACWYDPRPLAGVRERLKSSDRGEAAPALEYLGQLLPHAVFRSVSRLFETLETDVPGGSLDGDPVSSLIDAAWGSSDEWLRACAVRAARHAPDFDPSRFSAERADHPLVRAEVEALAARVRAAAVSPKPTGAPEEATC
jgi:HEAT repeat protein